MPHPVEPVSSGKSRGPLTGLRVLDLCRVVSGPYATQVLADLGAEVIRVESLPTEPEREFDATTPFTESEAFAWGLNRTKRSISLDLKSAEGRGLFTRLAAVADIVVDNFRPGVRQRLGIDYQVLSEINPGLISCSLTGFGQFGPWASMPAYDPIVQALCGTMNFTKNHDDGAPVRWGIPIGDIFAGLYSCIGILAAVLDRDATGLGQDIDIAMLDVMLALNSYRVPLALSFGQEPAPSPFEGGQGTVPYGTFECGDGQWLAIGVANKMWPAACRVIGRPELIGDERFATVSTRHSNRSVLVELFTEVLRTKPADEWQEQFLTNGVIAGKVTRINDVFQHPQLRARDMLVEISDANGRTASVVGDPLKFGDPSTWTAPTLLGADTTEVLRQLLGLGDVELADLAARHVIYRNDDPLARSTPYRPSREVNEQAIGRPLRELRVIELDGEEPSKAFAAQILADLGVEVVRVDRPTGTEVEPYPDDAREAAYRCGLNRNKRSVVADLKTEAGRTFLHALAASADAVIDNYRTGVLERLGADPATLRTVNPEIISLSVNGYGHTGPWAKFPAFDAAIQALGGGQSISEDSAYPGEPVRWGMPIGGLNGSMYAALGVLAALRLRNVDHQPRQIDLALLDAQVALLSYRVPQALTFGKQFLPEPRRGGSGSLPFGVFETADHRWFVITITQQFWARYCQVVDHPEWIDDARFATEPLRQQNEDLLNPMLVEAMRAQDVAVWKSRFFEAKLPGAGVATIAEAFAHEQAVAREMRLDLSDPVFPGGVAVAASPLRLSRTGPSQARPAPRAGTDTEAVAAELGVDLPAEHAGVQVRLRQ
ncbi:MAG: hypothetical protein JWQ77_1219 [Jatrophihabitans sp.]|nr:hypothetical protein [Jatrophihabitans sp.]